jgi:hypothetical protein
VEAESPAVRKQAPSKVWAAFGFVMSGFFVLISAFGIPGRSPEGLGAIRAVLLEIWSAGFGIAFLGLPVLAVATVLLFIFKKDTWAWRSAIAGSMLGPAVFILLLAYYLSE